MNSNEFENRINDLELELSNLKSDIIAKGLQTEFSGTHDNKKSLS